MITTTPPVSPTPRENLFLPHGEPAAYGKLRTSIRLPDGKVQNSAGGKNSKRQLMIPPPCPSKQIQGRSASSFSVSEVKSTKYSAHWTSPSIPHATQRKRTRNENTTPADRKLALLQKSGVFSSDTKGCIIEQACTLQELRAAYALVHDVFVGTGYIHPESGGIRLRIYEACPETATFIAKKDGEVVGVLSVVLDSRELGLPSDAAFKVELDALRKTGARLCEVTNQAVAKEYRRSALLTELMRCAIAYMLNAGCDHAIATVSPNHSGFYKFVGFDQLGAERSYSKKLHDPVVALCGDLSLLRKPRPSFPSRAEEYVHNFMTRANRFRVDAAERSRRAKQHFLSADLLKGLLLDQRNFFSECSLAELVHLRSSWGRELFDLVWETSGSKLSADTAFMKAPHLSTASHCPEIQDDWAELKDLFREYFSPDFSWLRSSDMAMES